MATLQLFFGGTKSFTAAELSLTLAQLTAADQALCSSGDVAHVAVGDGLLLVDVAYPSNRRLVETFTLTSLPSNPYGIDALQGMVGYTLQEAMLMCGAGLFAELRDIYMELFQVPVGAVDVLEASLLVGNTGISGTTPAALKELVGIGIDITSTDDAVTLTVDNTELIEVIEVLRSDVDANTLDLSNIVFLPYQLRLSAGTGNAPIFPILEGLVIRALQGDGEISMEIFGGIIRLSAAALRNDIDGESVLREALTNWAATAENTLNSDVAELSFLTAMVVDVEDVAADNTTILQTKQEQLGIGEPNEAHHKILQGDIVLSLTAKGSVTIQQRSNTHLEISSSGVDWTSGPATPGGFHFLDVGAEGLALQNPAGPVDIQFLNDGTAIFYTDVDVRGTLEALVAICPTLNTTLIKARNSTGVILTDNNGSICLKAINSDVVVPNELDADSIKANHISINGFDVIDILADREGKFTAGDPFIKTLVNGEVIFSIDETKPVTASAFQTGEFRLHSDTSDTLRFQRLDGDWQTAAQIKWSALGGALHVDSIRSNTGANVIIQDGMQVEGLLQIDGAIRTTAITALNNSGLALNTNEGETVFEAQDDKNSKMYGGLEVDTNVVVGGIVAVGAVETETIRPIENVGVTIDGDLHVQGMLTYNNLLSPYWVAGKILKDGTITASKGRRGFTVTRFGSDSSAWTIAFDAHPDGGEYVVIAASGEYHCLIRSAVATSFVLYVRKSTNFPGYEDPDGLLCFSVLA